MNAQNAISFVKTYTSTDWKNRKSSQKKRGITRIANMASQSKQKYEHLDIKFIGHNNQNYNFSNRESRHKQQSHLYPPSQKMPEQLNKAQIQKEQTNIQIKNTQMQGLVESHYLNCQEDVEQWLKVKEKLEERIGSLQLQNDFLKRNVQIQLQYIQKIQCQVDTLRSKTCKQNSYMVVQSYQQQEPKLIEAKSALQVKGIDIQCHLQRQEFQKFSQEVEQQTKLFENLIKQLEDQKAILQNANHELVMKIDSIEAKLQQQIIARQELKNNLTKEILNLVNSECNLKMNMQSFQQAKDKIKNEIITQNNMLKAQKQLRFQIQRQKQELLVNQNKRLADLQAKYSSYQQQLNYLLSFFEQKDQMLTERERKVERDQVKNGFYSQRLTEKENKVDEFMRLRNDYEDRISNIKNCMQGYLQQLANYRSRCRMQEKSRKTDAPEKQINKGSIWMINQRQISEDMDYLLKKVSSLEQLTQSLSKEVDRKQNQLINSKNLLNLQYSTVQNLEKQLELVQTEYKKSISQSKSYQIYFQSLKQQKQKLQSNTYIWQSQKQNLHCQIKMHVHQLKCQKEAFIELKIANQQKFTQLQTQYRNQKAFANLLREKNAKSFNELQSFKAQMQNKVIQINQLKRHSLNLQNQKTRAEYQNGRLNDELNSLQIQNKNKNSCIHNLRAQLVNISHQYEQMARAQSLAKNNNIKLYQQNIQLKQRFQDIKREIELITKSHSQQIKNMQGHITQIQKDFQLQKQDNLEQKKDYEKKIEMVKRDYDILYNKYLKYKNIALKMQPAHS